MQTQDCFKCNGRGKIHDTILEHMPGCIFCEKCKSCNKTGQIPGTAERCEKCQGRGKVHDSILDHQPGCIFCEKCKRCKGKGWIDNPNKFPQQFQTSVNFNIQGFPQQQNQGFPSQMNVNFNTQGFPQQQQNQEFSQQQQNQRFPQQQNQGFPQQQEFQGNINFIMNMGMGFPGMPGTNFTLSRDPNSQGLQGTMSMNISGVRMQFSAELPSPYKKNSFEKRHPLARSLFPGWHISCKMNLSHFVALMFFVLYFFKNLSFKLTVN